MARKTYKKQPCTIIGSNGNIYTEYRSAKKSYILLKRKKYSVKTKLNYISVPPGVGKTNWAIDKISDNTKSKKQIIIFAAPTIYLLEQTFANVIKKVSSKRRALLHLITSDMKNKLADTENEPITFSDTTLTKAEQVLANAVKGTALFVTHRTALRLSKELLGNTVLIFDEASDWDIYEKNISLDARSQSFLNSILHYEAARLEDSDHKINNFNDKERQKFFHPFYKLHANKKRERSIVNYLKSASMMKGSPDLRYILNQVLNKNYSMYLRYTPKKSGRYSCSFLGYASPDFFFSNFKSVMLVSAFFEQSVLYAVLNKNYRLVCRNDLMDTQATASIQEGYSRLEVVPIFDTEHVLSKFLLKNYFQCSQSQSAKVNDYARIVYNVLREKNTTHTASEKSTKLLFATMNATHTEHRILSEDVPIEYQKIVTKNLSKASSRINSLGDYAQDLIIDDIRLRLRSKTFSLKEKPLITANKKDYANNFFKISRKFTNIPAKSHGLNTYSEANVFISLAAFNPSPTRISFYKFLFGDDYNPIDSHVYNVIQGITRTSIRTQGNKKKVLVYVFSKPEAQRIKHITKNCVVSETCLAKTKNIYTIIPPYYNKGNNRFPILKLLDEKTCVQSTDTLSVPTYKGKSYRGIAEYRQAENTLSLVRSRMKKSKDEEEKEELEHERIKLLEKLRKIRAECNPERAVRMSRDSLPIHFYRQFSSYRKLENKINGVRNKLNTKKITLEEHELLRIEKEELSEKLKDLRLRLKLDHGNEKIIEK